MVDDLLNPAEEKRRELREAAIRKVVKVGETASPQLHTLCEGSPLRVTEVRRP